MAKIVVASDSFKGSASSLEIAAYVKKGIKSLYPEDEVILFAVADGGEGTVEAVMSKVSGTWQTADVQNPLGEPRQARYGLFNGGKSVILEMAEASGLTTVPEDKRDILRSSSYGTGQMMLQAMYHQPERLYVGLGGSATNDAGMGFLAALGVRFLDSQGQELDPIPSSFGEIAELDLTHFQTQPEGLDIILLSDVTNPLCGEFGASAVFAPQKGARSEEIDELEAGLMHFAKICEQATGKSCKDMAGAGAAGGLGFAFMTFFDVTVQSGIETVLDLVGFDQALRNADMVITGEGRMDGQSLHGKAPLGIAKRAQLYEVPTVAIVGSTKGDLTPVYQAGRSAVFPIINAPMTLEEAMEQTPDLVFTIAQGIANFYHAISQKTSENL